MLNRRQFLLGAATALVSATGCARIRLPSPKAPDGPPLVEEGPRPFRVALLSDPHTVPSNDPSAGGINGKLGLAVADYKGLKPDLWLVNGDATNRGKPEEYEAFKKILKGVSKPEQWLVNTGNHEFYDPDASDEEALRRFKEAFGLQIPYSSRVAGGIHFVMLSTEQWKSAKGHKEWAWLGADQLRWFDKVLAEQKQTFTVVCLHQPLQDTVFWSHGSSNTFAGCGQYKELQAILKRNPQVKLWLSGHTHMGAEIEGNVAHIGGVAYVGLGSTFYQFVRSEATDDQGGWPSYGGFKKDLSANQSRFMEVWPDRVVIKARDHASKAWMEKYELTLKRA